MTGMRCARHHRFKASSGCFGVASRRSIGLPRTAGIGAERKDVTLLMDFRSRSENGHSRYGHPAAQIAPEPSFTPRTRFG